MQIADLKAHSTDHLPAHLRFPGPYFAGHQGKLMLASFPKDVRVLHVGWLGERVPTTGNASADFIDRLFDLASDRFVVSCGTKGKHECEICLRQHSELPATERPTELREIYGAPAKQQRPRFIEFDVRYRDRDAFVEGYGYHFLQHANIVYFCPRLLLHYVVDHGYLPPEEFVIAVREGKFLTTDTLISTAVSVDAWMADHPRPPVA